MLASKWFAMDGYQDQLIPPEQAILIPIANLSFFFQCLVGKTDLMLVRDETKLVPYTIYDVVDKVDPFCRTQRMTHPISNNNQLNWSKGTIRSIVDRVLIHLSETGSDGVEWYVGITHA